MNATVSTDLPDVSQCAMQAAYHVKGRTESGAFLA